MSGQDWIGSKELALIQARQIQNYWAKRGVLVKTEVVDTGADPTRPIWAVRSNIGERLKRTDIPKWPVIVSIAKPIELKLGCLFPREWKVAA